ncbi:hypothetical protein EGW08_015713, partial [Elysia chlorotica]
KSCDLVLTCIDANTNYIALGSNIGTVFLYSRSNETMQRLKATNQGAVITSICLHDGVDDLVAVGCASGEVIIFCIPGLLSTQKKQIQKFEVQDVHRHFITCLKWSTNGMKLFSGDKIGQVAVTEIDFYQGMSKSLLLLIETSTEITQIDYQNRLLLVSTRQRSFVVRLDRQTETVQVGSKDRKIPGQFGACFIPELCKPDDVKLYAARPGCRLWLADIQGTVKSTHIFKDPLTHEVPEIRLLAAGKLQLQQEGFQFGKLLWMQNNTLVTWSSRLSLCLCRQSRLSGVVDVAVVSKTEEIFLLRRHGDARVIRISTKSELKVKGELKYLIYNSADVPEGKVSESDTVSQQSYDSAASSSLTFSFNSEDESTLKALSEADKMLSIVHNIITKESESKSEPSSDVFPQVSAKSKSEPSSDVFPQVSAKSKSEPSSYVSPQVSANVYPNIDSRNDNLKDAVILSDHAEKTIRPAQKEMSPMKYQSEPETSKLEDSLKKVSELTAGTSPKDKIPEKDTESIYSSSSDFTKSVSSHDGSDYVRETDSGNPVDDKACGDKHENSQHLYDPSLSEVDQHMEATPGFMDTSLLEKPMSQVNPRKNSDAVDSALARVTGVNEESDEHTKENAPDHVFKDSTSGVEKAVKPKIDKKAPFPLLSQQSFADIYMEIDSVNTDYFKKKEEAENTSEDFYSKYLEESYQESYSSNSAKTKEMSLSLPKKFAKDTHSQDVKKTDSHIANSWSEITAPANIYSLAVSDNHVWFTDKSENIYYSSLQEGKGIVWRKATGCASQISVSPSGNIVWRLCKGVVFAGTKISTRHPEGLKWVEAVREVQYIAVSNTCAWFIKRSGELMLQQGLSKERPCYRSRQVDCGPYRLKQVACGGQGVVWCITESLQLLVRTGVRQDLPAGDAWEVWLRDSPPYLFSHVAIDNENIGWAIDVSGRIWFCQGVTLENPKGSTDWFEVPLSGYVMQDTSMLDMIRAAAKIFDPSKLSHIMSTKRGGLVSAGSQGIWLAMDSRNLLQVCRGAIKGYHWMEAQPARMSASTMWRHVCAGMNHFDHGLVWAQQFMKHDIFAFKTPHGEAHNIVDCGDLVCISVAPLALWALSSDGLLWVRTGMGPDCPQGTGWAELNLAQLGDAHFVHLSCNSSYIWAVEAEGGVYQRIGTGPPSDADLNPVWLPIDTIGDLCFTKIFVSPLDWMVWGIDNRRLCFVRVGITESMPLGREWIHVPGIQAIDMTITKTGIWALNTQGEIFFRYGIALDNPTGDYWKKIPGALTKISASEDDELWGINLDGQLMCCKFNLLPCRQRPTDAFPRPCLTRDMSVNEDWEIV